jgi:hypothetical protein
MRKTIYLIALVGALFISCKKEGTASTVESKNPDQIGITVSKSANIEMVKKLTAMAENSDFPNFKANFAPKAVIHDNMNDISIDENIKMLEDIKANGMTISLSKKPLIWEIINDKADEKTGVKNYVFTYYDATFSRGGKSVVINYNMIFAIKDGKVVEEWDIYDSAPILNLLK